MKKLIVIVQSWVDEVVGREVVLRQESCAISVGRLAEDVLSHQGRPLLLEVTKPLSVLNVYVILGIWWSLKLLLSLNNLIMQRRPTAHMTRLLGII